MVTKAELISMARKQKLPLGLIEKDYVLTLVLREIYSSSFKNGLIFKGGTALHKLYLHKRLSVDLDFTALKKLDISAFEKVLTISEINSEIKKVVESGTSVSIDLKYVSLLNYPDSIKIDVSLRETPLLKLKEIELSSPYFSGFNIRTFQIEEMAAEKLRALVQRKWPRDYFDMWILLKEIEFKDFEKLAKKKLLAVNDKLSIDRVFIDLDIVKSLCKLYR